MAKGYRQCRVCGKEYEYCQTFRPFAPFRWQDVACCPEHAEEYLARVAAAAEEQNDTGQDTDHD